MQRRDEHLLPAVLARLVEHGKSAATEIELRHLAQCGVCMAAYAEVVTVRAEHRAGRPEPLVPEAWLETGRALASRPHAAATSVKPAPSRHRLTVRVAVPVLAAFALAVGVWHARENPVPADVRQQLRLAMRQNSSGSLLYAEDLIPESTGRRGSPGSSLSTALGRLANESAKHPDSEEVAYWWIGGLLAADRLDEAETNLRPSLAAFDSQARFHNLAAILAFRRSDLPMAEKELRRQAAIEPSALAFFNLALVLQEQGKHEEARALRDAVEKRFPASPIAALARLASAPEVAPSPN